MNGPAGSLSSWLGRTAKTRWIRYSKFSSRRPNDAFIDSRGRGATEDPSSQSQKLELSRVKLQFLIENDRPLSFSHGID